MTVVEKKNETFLFTFMLHTSIQVVIKENRKKHDE